MKKILLASLFGFALGLVPAHAEVVIKLRPPVSVREQRAARPSKKHVWVGGYQKWNGNAYAWERGRWEEPPHARGVWVAPRYVKRRDGYVFVEGHWR